MINDRLSRVLHQLVCIAILAVSTGGVPFLRANPHNVVLEFGSVSASLDGGGVLLLKSPVSSSPEATINVNWLVNPVPPSGQLTLRIKRGSDKIVLLKENGDPLSETSWNDSYPTAFKVRAAKVSTEVGDVEIGLKYVDDPEQTVTMTVVKVSIVTSNIVIPSSSPPVLYAKDSEENARYGYGQQTTFDVNLKVEPSAARDLVSPRIIQVGKGSINRFYRTPPAGVTKSVAEVPDFSFDGEYLATSDEWRTYANGWFTDNAGDIPEVVGFCKQWKTLTASFNFEVYIQYSVDSGATWHSLKKGTWSFFGAAEIGAFSNGRYPDPTGAGATAVRTSNFTDFSGAVSAPTPSMPDQLQQFSDQ